MTEDDATLPPHPGTIRFEDADGRLTDEVSADEAGPIAYARDAEGRQVPVTRIVADGDGPGMTIRQYGADGTLLLTTIAQ